MRLPRTATEARTNVRYFDELGYRVTRAGFTAESRRPRAPAWSATDVAGLDGALSVALFTTPGASTGAASAP